MDRLIFIGFLFFLTCSVAAQDKPSIELEGQLFDRQTKFPVGFATIQIINRNKGTNSSELGKFHLQVFLGDTIRFSSIGYEPLLLIITNELAESAGEEPLELEMAPAVYELDSVVVEGPAGDFYLRRKRGKPVEVLGLPKVTDNPTDWSVPNTFRGAPSDGRFGFQYTITGLLNYLDKDIIQQKKIEKLEESAALALEYKEKIASRFNKEFVKEITGIDDRVIEEFMEFCKFSDGFLLHSSEYELILKLQEKYRAFLHR